MLTNTRRLALVSLLSVGLLPVGPAYAAKPDKKTKPTPKAEKAVEKASSDTTSAATTPKTATVKRGPVKAVATLSGVVESSGSATLALAPKEWTQLVVVAAKPVGTRVTKGETVVTFETDKLEEAISTLQDAHALADLSIRQAENELQIIEQGLPLQSELVERQKQHADQDLTRFTTIEGPFSQRSSAQQVKMMEQYFEYVQEELKQLEKMYKADELTDDTEEIILKRARNDVEQMRFMVESVKMQSDQELKVQLPRMLEQYQTAAQTSSLTLQRAKALLPLQIARQKLELEKLKKEHTKTVEKLAAHQQDLKLLTLTAPIDGYVYYGQSTRGKWNSADLAAKLRPGGTVAAHEVLMTIVPQQSLAVIATLPEKELAEIQVGAAATLRFPALGKKTFNGKLRSTSNVPISEGNFEAIFDLTDPAPGNLVAGMTSEVKVTTHFNPTALLVPSKAVFTDDIDDSRYVFVSDKDGKATKRVVTVGATQGESLEITGGIEADTHVLLEKPAETTP